MAGCSGPVASRHVCWRLALWLLHVGKCVLSSAALHCRVPQGSCVMLCFALHNVARAPVVNSAEDNEASLCVCTLAPS